MNRKGFGTIEIVVLVASIISALGGAWLGYDYGIPAQKADDGEKVIVIDTRGEARTMELHPGKSYDATITPDGRLIVKEKP